MEEIRGEHPLDDEYPVYAEYWYVVDGEPKRSPIEGTVLDLKRTLQAKEVCRCNATRRNLPIVPWD